MKIILVEFIDEAQALLRLLGREIFLKGDVRVVCLQPQVRVFLKKMGIEADDTIPYLNNEAQHRIVLKSEEWTLELLRDIELVDSFGIKQGYHESCIHYLRLYINYFLFLIEVLEGIYQKHNVSEICVAVLNDRSKMYGGSLSAMGVGYIQDRERYLGFMAQDFGMARGIKVVTAPLNREKSDSSLLAGAVHQIVKLIAWIDYTFFVNPKPVDQVIVVPGLSYRMDKILTEIKESHPHSKSVLIWHGDATFKRNLFKVYLTVTNFWKKLKKKNVVEWAIHLDLIKLFFKINQAARAKFIAQFDKLLAKFKNEFRYKGILINPYLKEKIAYGLKEEIIGLQHSTFVLAQVFKKIHPKLLMSMYSSSIYYMMGELANYYKFPALNISHGTHVPPNNEYEKIENYRLATSVISNTYPVVAVQTPWAGRFLDYYQDSRQRLLTGPLLYSVTTQTDRQIMRKEIAGDDPAAKIVVHATTQKGRQSLRFHITETLDEYIAAIVDLIHAVNQLDHVYLVVRPHPVCKLSEDELRLMLPDCPRLRILNTGSFSRILSAADLLISYSSTVIEEALQNDIPVILYDKWCRYNHFNVEETMSLNGRALKPVSYLTNPKYLRECIEKKLSQFNHGGFEPDFVKAYKYPKEYRRNFLDFVDQSLKH